VTSGRVLARNSALNIVGQALPLIVAVLAIPPLLRGLGTERFGVLTLAWATIGYFSLFELGLSRALVQAMAVRLGRGEAHELSAVARSGIAALFALGIAGGALLAAVSTSIVTDVLNIPSALQRESVVSFWILAATLPFVLVTVGIRALFEAHQHFGMATALRAPLVAFTFAGPLFVLPFTKNLAVAVAAIAIGRILTCAAHVVLAVRRYPYLSEPGTAQIDSVKALLRFGGWVTVTNLVSPIMVYLDRFIIGASMSVAAVAAYVAPYELVVKLLILPSALMGAFVPALAFTRVSDPARMATLYEQSLRTVTLLMFPVLLVVVAFAQELLQLWIGTMFSSESARVLQWLSIGVFLSAMAQAPYAVLQSAGRPDLIARLHVLELPVYALTLLLVMRTGGGLQGIAITWTARAVIDAVALAWLAHRHIGVTLVPRLGGAWASSALLLVMAGSALLTDTLGRIIYVALVLAIFAPFAWFTQLTASERDGIRGWLRRPVPPDAPPMENVS
jgi:O-antigen/teichoic acid export membrane protein